MTPDQAGESRIAHLLPRAMAEDDFTRRFASIFESLQADILARVAGAGRYFDPSIAPLEFVRMLAGWTNLPSLMAWEGDSDGERHTREFVAAASPLFRWRGTRRGLEELLGHATGGRVTVIDPAGVSIGGTRPTEPTTGPVQIRLHLPRGAPLTEAEIDVLVRTQLPAGVHFELVFESEGGTDA